MLTISDFTNLYPVSKTLRWALRPIGKTAHYVNENHILENDRQKAKTYEKAKKILEAIIEHLLEITSLLNILFLILEHIFDYCKL